MHYDRHVKNITIVGSEWVLDPFPKLRQATITFIMSVRSSAVRPSAWNPLALDGF